MDQLALYLKSRLEDQIDEKFIELTMPKVVHPKNQNHILILLKKFGNAQNFLQSADERTKCKVTYKLNDQPIIFRRYLQAYLKQLE